VFLFIFQLAYSLMVKYSLDNGSIPFMLIFF